MISQGDFRRLLQADTKQRQKIFRDICGTALFVTLQNQLKEKSANLRDQREQAGLSIAQYIAGMRCDAASDLATHVQKAHAGQLPLADVMVLFENLLQQDGDTQHLLDRQLTEAEHQSEIIATQLTQAQAYQTAKRSLAQREAAEKTQIANTEAAAVALDAAQATLPEQENLSRQITQLEMLLPAYDELEQKRSEAKADLPYAEFRS
jgi:exonuclease SbcC